MWTLQALSRGHLTANLPAIGRVHSVFKRAVNIQYSEHGEILTTLLAEEFPNQPSGIRVDTKSFSDWRVLFQPGEVVGYRAGVLRGKGVALLLHATPIWQPEHDGYVPVLPLLTSRLQKLRQWVQQYCVEKGVNSQLPLVELLEGRQGPLLLLASTLEAQRNEVAQLVGWGCGLTPDGDDFLLGYLAAYQLTQGEKYRVDLTNHYRHLQQDIEHCLSATTDISRHYLALALAGHYSEAIHHFIAALSQPHVENELPLLQAALAILQCGATSGADCLSGILYGLAHCWQDYFD